MVIAVVTQKEARVWAHGTAYGTHPETILPPDPKMDHAHARTGNDDHMHHVDSGDPRFFERIAHAISGGGRLLLVGHGKGKGSEVDRFRKYLHDKYPRLSENVVGTLHVNLEALTEAEVLSMSREWFEQQVKAGQISD